MASPLRVSSLHVYPVKGARGISLARAEVLKSGLRHDRRFVLVDAERKFVTQRQYPRLALVDVAIDAAELTLSAGGEVAHVPLAVGESRDRVRVRVWDDEVEAAPAGAEGSAFFSRFVGAPLSLVMMPPDVVRQVDLAYAQTGDRVGFADAFPLLVASSASLADLNERIVATGGVPVPMNRFRPNIVVDGGAAFAEDEARSARIGDLAMRTPKRCARCTVTTVDQATAETGKEPLRTLARYRTEANQTYFAINGIPELPEGGSAWIAVGDEIVFA